MWLDSWPGTTYIPIVVENWRIGGVYRFYVDFDFDARSLIGLFRTSFHDRHIDSFLIRGRSRLITTHTNATLRDLQFYADIVVVIYN